jgi:Glyoxalase/Bleomycin resistance protein/Dioxygenase superfamily
MALHRLTRITLGVPDVDTVAAYYEEFGLERMPDGGFVTTDGGQQLRLEHSPYRRLLHLGIGADSDDDIGRIASSLTRFGVPFTREPVAIRTIEPIVGFTVEVSEAPRYAQAPAVREAYNLPGRIARVDARAGGILREGQVRPRRLGHVVIGSTNREVTERFFLEGLGFKISDSIRDVATFMRCSPDHHNILVQSAPVNFLHHTAWQVEDIDEIGRGAMNMLEGHPERHGWGLGRHFIGSNFFWYLMDPAGNFSEYYSDIDTILDDQLWKPEVFEGAKGLYAWGPTPNPSFLHPEDLAALMTGLHAPS